MSHCVPRGFDGDPHPRGEGVGTVQWLMCYEEVASWLFFLSSCSFWHSAASFLRNFHFLLVVSCACALSFSFPCLKVTCNLHLASLPISSDCCGLQTLDNRMSVELWFHSYWSLTERESADISVLLNSRGNLYLLVVVLIKKISQQKTTIPVLLF